MSAERSLSLRRSTLTLLVSTCLSSCALFKLPAVCDLGPFQLEETSFESLLQPEPVAFSNQVIAGMSARRLEEGDAERIGHLITWQSSFPRCIRSETPVPMDSNHKLARLVLARTGSGFNPIAIALSNSCWRRKFRSTEDLFLEDKAAPLFCDSLDPELVLDTTKRQEEDAATLQEMRDAGDSLAIWLLGPMLSDQRLYAYRYMEKVLPAIAGAVKDELVGKLPPSIQPVAKALRLTVVYDTDVLFAKIPSSKDRLLVSAPVLRAAYAGALKTVLPDLEVLRTEYFQVRGDPVKLEQFRDKAIDSTEGFARKVWFAYRQSLAFTLAHEMAHAYAARAGEDLASEETADCFAVVNLIDWSELGASPGMFDLLVADAIQPSGGVWARSALSQVASSNLIQRKDRVAAFFAQGRRMGAATLRAQCAA